MATLVASSSSSSESTTNSKATIKTKATESGSTTVNQKFAALGNNTPPAFCNRLPPNTRVEALPNELEVIEFLRDHFIPNEPILSSLCISNIDELTVLLSDVVNDCITCPASSVIRNIETGCLLGVCLASRSSLFEKQMDRLFSYEFSDPQLCIAIEFLKSVFNRADVPYHLEENNITKPVFVAIIAVHVSFWNKGIGSALLDNCLASAVEDGCDGALALCSSSRASRLMLKRFGNVVCRTRYCDYRGEYRSPPISPPSPESALHVLLTKL